MINRLLFMLVMSMLFGTMDTIMIHKFGLPDWLGLALCLPIGLSVTIITNAVFGELKDVQ